MIILFMLHYFNLDYGPMSKYRAFNCYVRDHNSISLFKVVNLCYRFDAILVLQMISVGIGGLDMNDAMKKGPQDRLHPDICMCYIIVVFSKLKKTDNNKVKLQFKYLSYLINSLKSERKIKSENKTTCLYFIAISQFNALNKSLTVCMKVQQTQYCWCRPFEA